MISAVVALRNAVQRKYPFIFALESVKELADEIVVCDGNSEDDTISALEEWEKNSGATIKVFQVPWEKGLYGEPIAYAQNIGITRCKGPWALVIQADEILHERAVDEIRKVVSSDRKDAYFCSFVHLGPDIHHWNPKGFPLGIRLARKGCFLSTGDGWTMKESESFHPGLTKGSLVGRVKFRLGRLFYGYLNIWPTIFHVGHCLTSRNYRIRAKVHYEELYTSDMFYGRMLDRDPFTQNSIDYSGPISKLVVRWWESDISRI